MYNNVSMPTSYVAGRNCHFAPTPWVRNSRIPLYNSAAHL